MFNWLKRKASILRNWNFGDLEGFKMIQNPDSVQYINNNGTKAIYFSILNFSEGNVFSLDSYVDKPIVMETDSGWQLKGAKKSKNQILVCVISISEEDHIGWARTFFDSIVSD